MPPISFRALFRIFAVVLLPFVGPLAGCDDDSTSDGGDAAMGTGGADDGAGGTATNSGGGPGDTGGGGSVTGSGGSGGGCADELSDTQMVVDGTTYYLVTQSVLPDPNAYRVQFNFADKVSAGDCSGEPGSNSAFIIVATFKSKPASSGSYTFSDSRFPTADDTINFYMTFFADRGTTRDDKSYLSPAEGEIELMIAGGSLSASFSMLTMTNEADATDSFTLQGTFATDW